MNAAERPCLLHRPLALAAALLLLGGLFLSPALGLHAQAEEISSTQKLRVGYYAYTGFNMIDADGSYSGYSYELLQKNCAVSQRYLRIRRLRQRRERRDADAGGRRDRRDPPTCASRLTARIDLIFTTSPVGTIASMLTVRAGNRTVIAGEYSTYNGMTVGFSHDGNGRNQSFIEFAADHNFTYTAVFYDTDDELAEALHKGEITAALTNANRITTDEWVLETFDETPFYMAVRKGRHPNTGPAERRPGRDGSAGTLLAGRPAREVLQHQPQLHAGPDRGGAGLPVRYQRRQQGVDGSRQPRPLPLLLQRPKRQLDRYLRSSCSTCWPGARASATDCWMPTPATTI